MFSPNLDIKLFLRRCLDTIHIVNISVTHHFNRNIITIEIRQNCVNYFLIFGLFSDVNWYVEMKRKMFNGFSSHFFTEMFFLIGQLDIGIRFYSLLDPEHGCGAGQSKYFYLGTELEKEVGQLRT